MITKEEVERLIAVDTSIEKFSTVSSDGKTLVIRIPKDIREFMKIKKGSELKWILETKSRKIKLEVVESGKAKKN